MTCASFAEGTSRMAPPASGVSAVERAAMRPRPFTLSVRKRCLGVLSVLARLCFFRAGGPSPGKPLVESNARPVYSRRARPWPSAVCALVVRSSRRTRFTAAHASTDSPPRAAAHARTDSPPPRAVAVYCRLGGADTSSPARRAHQRTACRAVRAVRLSIRRRARCCCRDARCARCTSDSIACSWQRMTTSRSAARMVALCAAGAFRVLGQSVGSAARSVCPQQFDGSMSASVERVNPDGIVSVSAGRADGS